MKLLIGYKIKVDTAYEICQKINNEPTTVFQSFSIKDDIESKIINFDNDIMITESLIDQIQAKLEIDYFNDYKEHYKRLNVEVKILGVTKIYE